MNTVDLQNLTRRFWRGETEPQGVMDVVEIEGIMEMSGYAKTTIYIYANAGEFPSPVARTGRKLFWRKEDIERWIRIKKSTDD
jgi:predicted DNA-binding transcriptional regulator AlpA